MKMKQTKKPGQLLQQKVTSCTWAFALLTPIIVVAGYTESIRLLFHVMLFVTGWFCWSYTEYFIHRFVMHEGSQQKGVGRLLNHTHHHTDPEDIRIKAGHRVLMIVGCILFVAVSLWADNYFTLAFGYVTGFTAYSLMHVILHQSWSARVFPGLHRFHIHHHCKHPDKCFGVITTWWDYLFNTSPASDTEITDRIKQFYYKRRTTEVKKDILSFIK
jgi:sterol desaturase/sphingolipid hydroxylase (fatty acid hydroxylase superfamily)